MSTKSYGSGRDGDCRLQSVVEQARKHKGELNEAINPATGKPLAKATIRSRLMALKAFVH